MTSTESWRSSIVGGAARSARSRTRFFYELGKHALVVEQGAQMIGFLLGFLVAGSETTTIAESPAVPTGYVHLVGIHPDYRLRGVGRLLYDRFTDECRESHCLRMKAITTPGNEGSIRFISLSGGAYKRSTTTRSRPSADRFHQAARLEDLGVASLPWVGCRNGAEVIKVLARDE